MRAIKLGFTTDTSGDAVTTGASVNGQLYAVVWDKGTADNGVDCVCASVNSAGAATLLTLTDANASAIYYPRHLVHSEAGAALTGTAGGDRALPIAAGNLRITVAQGGSAKTGSVTFYVIE